MHVVCKTVQLKYIEANSGPNGCLINRSLPSCIYVLFAIVYCTTNPCIEMSLFDYHSSIPSRGCVHFSV